MAKTLVSLDSATITVVLAGLISFVSIVDVAPLRALHTVGTVSHDYIPEIVEVLDTSTLCNELLHDNLGSWFRGGFKDLSICFKPMAVRLVFVLRL